MWPNWAPQNDFEINGDRRTAPIAPNPGPRPDTDILLSVAGYAPGESPAQLIVPWRQSSDNAHIPAKGVAGIGPQTGEVLVIYANGGAAILPGWQRYLEIGGQKEVGILPRTVPVEQNQLWDAEFTLNPAIEVV